MNTRPIPTRRTALAVAVLAFLVGLVLGTPSTSADEVEQTRPPVGCVGEPDYCTPSTTEPEAPTLTEPTPATTEPEPDVCPPLPSGDSRVQVPPDCRIDPCVLYEGGATLNYETGIAPGERNGVTSRFVVVCHAVGEPTPVPPTTTITPATTTPDPALPVTGSDSTGTTTFAAAGLILAGVALVLIGRRSVPA